MRTYRSEFPEFTLDVVIPSGFKDESWHNDAMPCFTKSIADERTLRLWIDYTNPDMREFDTAPRFALVSDIDGEDTIEIMSTDDYAEIVAYLN